MDGGEEIRTHVKERMVADGKRKQAGQTSRGWKRIRGGQDLGTSLTQGPWGFMAKKAGRIPLH